MRNYRGFEYNSGYPDCELSLEQFKHILTPDVLAMIMQPTSSLNQKSQGVSFNGNLGDFASARDAIEIVKYLTDHNVNVYINTNGSLRNTNWWAQLAHPRVTVGFALDGLADTHSLYRQDTNWNKIVNNAQAFIAAGGQAIWRFIPFEHNRHQEEDCRALAKELGFLNFENIYDGRDSTPVFTRTGEYSHQIGFDTRPAAAVPKIQDLLHGHITWFDAKTVVSNKDKTPLNLHCTHKIHREIYIAANGTVYPCCYLGFYPETMHHPGNSQLKPMVSENNALEHSLEHCMRWFESVEQGWGKQSIADGRLYHCVSNCGRL
jgi:sulfatase maturation enzyme AslB (radical SAM superfamily)